jgi:hypothetical protein
VRRAALAGGSDEEEANEESEVESVSRDRLVPRPLPLSLQLSVFYFKPALHDRIN